MKTFWGIFAAVVAALLLVILIAGASCASCIGSSLVKTYNVPAKIRH